MIDIRQMFCNLIEFCLLIIDIFLLILHFHFLTKEIDFHFLTKEIDFRLMVLNLIEICLIMIDIFLLGSNLIEPNGKKSISHRIQY